MEDIIEIEEGEFLLQVDMASAENSRVPWNMLEYNQISNLLPFQYYYKDDKVCFQYTTGDLQSIEDYFQRKNGSFETLFFLCSEIIYIVENGEEYLLKSEEYMMMPERIYWNRLKKEVWLCYLPGSAGNMKRGYTALVEYLLEHTDHKDQQGVTFIYGLYDILVSDNFSVEGLKNYFSGFIKSHSDKEKRSKVEKSRPEIKCYLLYSGELRKNHAFWEQNIGRYQVPAQEMVKVGRGTDNDIVLPFPEISRRQAVIIQENKQLFLKDCNSTNGTYLNRKLLSGKEKAPCQEGDEVKFANYSFQLVYQ